MPLFGAWTTTTPMGLINGTAQTASSLPFFGITNGYASTAQAAVQPTLLSSSQYWPSMLLGNQTTMGGAWASINPCYYVETPVDHQQYMALAQQRVVHFRERTAEETARAEEQVRVAQEIATRRRRDLDQALARSRDLLLEHLTPEQRKTFMEKKWFIVDGGKTRTKYRINIHTHTHNIEVMRGEKVAHRLCAHCTGVIPLHDHHLAQKLSLECDEEDFLKIANRSAA